MHQGTFDIRLTISTLARDTDPGFDNLNWVLRSECQWWSRDWTTVSTGGHMVVYLNGVLRESAELFVVAVAAATEEGRAVEVVDDGVRTGPSEGADGV